MAGRLTRKQILKRERRDHRYESLEQERIFKGVLKKRRHVLKELSK